MSNPEEKVVDAILDMLTPEAIAARWSDWSSSKQAEFFNELARLSSAWDEPRVMQWRYMEKDLTVDAARMLEEMADHTDGARA